MSIPSSVNSSNSLQLNGTPGFKFKITNDQGVESYLVGTSHVVDKSSIQDPDINKIIDKCSVLYTELGHYTFLTSSQGSEPEEEHQYQHLPFRYSYDTAFTIAAWCKKIPEISLDISFPGRSERYEESFRIIRELGPDEFEEGLMGEYEKLCADGPPGGSRFYAWKKGDILAREKDRKNDFDVECVEREKHWAKILVPHLRSTTQPICIAVGAYHVVGDGLPEIFRKAGLKVEWIRPRSPASIPQKCARAVRKTVQALLPALRSRL